MGGVFGKSDSIVLDHSYNIRPKRIEDPDVIHGSIATIMTNKGNLPPDKEDVLLSLYETKAEKRARRRSLVVAFVTMFVMSIGFSIVLTGVWPYLQTLNKSVGKEYVGWVVAANPLGQVLTSPLLGLWGNKAGGIRIPCIVTVIASMLGNIMYSLLPAMVGAGEMTTYYCMIISRVIVGVASACVGLTRSYIASATTLKERTVAFSIIAASQSLGIAFGPVIQAILTALIPEEVDTGIWWLKWNQYTACSWVAAAMGLINLIILMPCVFKEHNIAAKELAMMKTEDKNVKLPKLDKLGIFISLFSIFLSLFIITFIETLAEPLVQDQYGWSHDMSVIVSGIGLAVVSFWSVVMYVSSGYLCRKYDERKVLLCFGYPLVVLGSFLFIPFAGDTIAKKCQNETTTVLHSITPPLPNSSFFSSAAILPNETAVVFTDTPSTVMQVLSSTGLSTIEPEECQAYGCPYEEQPWCAFTPQIPLIQLGIAFFIVMSGFPVCISICQAIYSKILGPKPQGLWMGVMTTAGGLSRMLGPIFVTYIYTYYGTYVTFGALAGSMALGMIALSFNYNRLVAMKIPSAGRMNGYDNLNANGKF